MPGPNKDIVALMAMSGAEAREGHHEDVARGFDDAGSSDCADNTYEANYEFAEELLNEFRVTPLDS